MEDFDKGAKRKCTSCSVLFFDFGKSPIICPSCGATVSSLLTNVSKRGRPPKALKEEGETINEKDQAIQTQHEDKTDPDVNVDLDVDVEINSDDEDSVEEMIEIKRDEDS